MRSMNSSMTGMLNMCRPLYPMAQEEAKMKMDLGLLKPISHEVYVLLKVYDSNIFAPPHSGSFPFYPPAGATQVVIRCAGPAGGGLNTDTGYGSNPRYMTECGPSGGAFAKTTLYNVFTTDAYNTVSSYNGVNGLGISINGTVVCFAAGGAYSDADVAHAGGAASQCVGDVRRSGGAGTPSSGGTGGDGDHGAIGQVGATVTTLPNPPFSSQTTYNTYGGAGGQAGDYGDPDGIGFGWDTATGQKYVSNTFALESRWVVYFYGYESVSTPA